MDIFQKVQSHGDVPSPRFAHSITKISPSKAILFGGAIGEAGKFIITNQTFLFDLHSHRWTRLEFTGSVPQQRAAHDATCVDENQLIIYGGASSGGGGLCSDELILLKQQNEEFTWVQIPVSGPTPGKRYGHCLIHCKPFLVVFGGNTGTTPVNDVWILNIEKVPYSWQNVNCGALKPSPRVYHAGALCQIGSASGMIVIFGGRLQDQSSSNETWGLRRHRDGRWDWVQAPYRNNTEVPNQRFQHSIMFLGSLMIVSGGRTNNIDELFLPVEIYDTENSEWIRGVNFTRYRHAAFLFNTTLYFHGGFEPDKPNLPLDSIIGIDLAKISNLNQKIQKFETVENHPPERIIQSAQTRSPVEPLPRENRATTPLRQTANKKQEEKNIRIAPVVYTAQNNANPDLQQQLFYFRLIRKVPLMNLAEEGKKLNPGFQEYRNSKEEGQSEFFINMLLKKDWKHTDKFFIKKENIIKLCDDMIEDMINQPTLVRLRIPIKIFGDIHGRYGDLMKLFQLFGTPNEEQGIGDIEKFNYVFMGNYVDFGFNSLEVVCLLFALKLKHKESICLLRGAHEDLRVNRIFGLGEECALRLNEDIEDPNSVFQKINQVFDYLPLAGLIEQQILCVHGGLGKEIKKIDQIEQITRPLSVLSDWQEKDNELAIDLLWSEFMRKDTDNFENKKKDYFKTQAFYNFNEKRVKGFIRENQISLVVRSGEIVNEGFEKSCLEKLITITSCTDFYGSSKNQASMIKIKKNWELNPVVINQVNPNQGPWVKIGEQPFRNAPVHFTEEEIQIRKQFVL